MDDQEDFRRLVREMLNEDNGFQLVAEATDGDEAVELAEQEQPDVVLMDVMMPRMNGFEATRRILDRHPETKVVLMSVSTDKEVAQASQQAGAVAFIPKAGLTLKALRAAIRALG